MAVNTPAWEEELIATFARRQHGLVTRAQLLSAGLSVGKLDRRIATHRFRPVLRGVYQVGPLPQANGREMAAVLACGPGARVSHRSAATLLELLPRNGSGQVHVTVVGLDRGRRAGITVHRVPSLEPTELASVDGIPITSAGRTLFDLAGVVGIRELEQSLAQALHRRLVSRPDMLALLARHAHRRGIGALRSLLEADAEPALARSEAEERFLALTREAGLPAPETNVSVDGREVDFLWRRERLVVEVDGFAFHSSRRKFQSDRRKGVDLSALGFQVIRVTWRQLTHEPVAMMVRLAQALARSGPR